MTKFPHIQFVSHRPEPHRRHYVDEKDVKVVLSRLPEDLLTRLKKVHFTDDARGNRALGYTTTRGKVERWHPSVKQECVRRSCPETLEQARDKVASYVAHYNQVRLHSAIGYVTPEAKLNGLEREIHAERDRKLQQHVLVARRRGKLRELARRSSCDYNESTGRRIGHAPSADLGVEYRRGAVGCVLPLP